LISFLKRLLILVNIGHGERDLVQLSTLHFSRLSSLSRADLAPCFFG
jgi:hypothetical protein